ncbi:MAG: response regulator transcription factor [Methylococcales bacterium]|nr:response regulator transcription factor [Methylococcales bacterium]
MTINLVLVDDHPLVLNGLQQLFAVESEISVLACCTDGEQVLQTVIHYQPDILILDLKMPRKNGLAVLRELQKEKLPTKVVLLTAALDDDEVLEAIRLGVRGVVLKEMAPQLLVQCVNKVHAGGEWLEKDSVGRALEKMLKRETEMQYITQILTRREIKLVKLVANGLSNKLIAEKLFIAEGTVKVHLHNIYDKLQVKSRVALTLYAQEKGLV